MWDWRAFLAVFVIFSQQVLFAGQGPFLGLFFSIEDAALLLMLLFTSRYRTYVSEFSGVGTLGALLLLILIVQALDLMPVLQNPTSTAWRLVGEAPRASPYPAGVLIEGTKLLALACLFLCGAILSRERRQKETLLTYLLIAGIVFALFCLVLNALNMAPMTETKASISTGRLSGPFSSPNTAATAFAINGVLAAGLLFRKLSSASRAGDSAYSSFLAAYLELSGLLLSTGCLILTGSRGGILAYAVGLVLVAGPALARGGTLKRVPVMVALFLLGLLVASTGAGLLIDRIFHAENIVSGRSDWLKIYLGDAIRAPWGGYGLGSFDAVNRFYSTPANFKPTSWAGAVHDLYVQWFLEGGASCLALLLLLVLIMTLRNGGDKGRANYLKIPMLSVVSVGSIYEYSMQEFAISSLYFLLAGNIFMITKPSSSPPRN